MELPDLLRMVAVIIALIGGCLSLAAFYQKRKGNQDVQKEKLANRIYFMSYVFMSISIFAFAFSALIFN